MRGMGACTATNQAGENLRTPVGQYPNGRLMIKTVGTSTHKISMESRVQTDLPGINADTRLSRSTPHAFEFRGAIG